MLTLLFIGVATAFAMLILKWKLEHGRYADVALDAMAMIILSMFLGHTLGGMVVAIVASTIISLYLMVFPPRFRVA